MVDLIYPNALNKGDTIGVFTPSFPAYKINPGLFDNGLKNLESLGFKIKLGHLTKNRSSEGYRSANGKERALEFMNLILDPDVKCLISTIGGKNSSSMLPFLDFDLIRKSRKIICGFSDVTSLHLAILKISKLRTFYGPSVMCWFGEWPNGIEESTKSFLNAVMEHQSGERELKPFKRWSNHKRSWENDDWKNKDRIWQPNEGWTAISEGVQDAPLFAFNLNTLVSTAGTPYFPHLDGQILLLEEMDAPLSLQERHFRQLEFMGVFDKIKGLILSKPENFDQEGASFGYHDLVLEIIGKRSYPILGNFDCGHTVPMETIPQGVRVHLNVNKQIGCQLKLLESAFK